MATWKGAGLPDWRELPAGSKREVFRLLEHHDECITHWALREAKRTGVVVRFALRNISQAREIRALRAEVDVLRAAKEGTHEARSTEKA